MSETTQSASGAYYPEYTPQVKKFLTLVPKFLKENPDYLESVDCPYEETDLIRNALGVFGDKEILPKDSQFYTDQEIDMAEESKAMYWEIQTFKKSLDVSDVSEKVALFRLSTSLLEKLLEVKERATGIRHFEEFQALILDTMDKYLSPQQKSEFSQSMDALFNDTE